MTSRFDYTQEQWKEFADLEEMAIECEQIAGELQGEGGDEIPLPPTPDESRARLADSELEENDHESDRRRDPL